MANKQFRTEVASVNESEALYCIYSMMRISAKLYCSLAGVVEVQALRNCFSANCRTRTAIADDIQGTLQISSGAAPGSGMEMELQPLYDWYHSAINNDQSFTIQALLQREQQLLRFMRQWISGLQGGAYYSWLANHIASLQLMYDKMQWVLKDINKKAELVRL